MDKIKVSRLCRILGMAGLITALVAGLAACNKPAEPEIPQVETVPVEILISEDEPELSVLEDEPESTDIPEEISVEAEPETEPIDMLAYAAGEVIDVDTDRIDEYFKAYEIPDPVFERINGRSYRENPNVSLDDIRYLKVVHYNFQHELQVGEVIVNTALADEFLAIFRELYDAEYEIQSMHLVDNYWTGDGGSSDSASIEQNNTSAFCYRTATGGGKLSNHAYGRAIDINPQQNPYVNYSSGYPSYSHANASDYIDRSTGYAHVITHDDICYQIFAAHGFSWGGDWDTVKDYQHFEREW